MKSKSIAVVTLETKYPSGVLTYWIFKGSRIVMDEEGLRVGSGKDAFLHLRHLYGKITIEALYE